MRPIIGVNGDCLWPCGDVCHSPPSLPAPRSHGKLRRRLTGTGVGSNFRFVADLELQPATRQAKTGGSQVGVLSTRQVQRFCNSHSHQQSSNYKKQKKRTERNRQNKQVYFYNGRARAQMRGHSELSRNAFRAEPFRTFRYPWEPSLWSCSVIPPPTPCPPPRAARASTSHPRRRR